MEVRHARSPRGYPLVWIGARREVLSALAERYRSAGRMEKERILDALCRTPGWHRKHALRALRRRVRREDSQDQKPA